ncbi:hypothetical protein BDN72DRAFT_858264 [Pluteus cervinus]|uniref:Uncharacterized protein n=1 Tax=Pluteus cervinus TaxID=181527 RepID=A0ACD3ASD3_9AGAR|nr:hypothetical protein BDN72DRAFT_858264 [Pluteus cervinus]
MPGGRRNPLSINNIIEKVGDVVHGTTSHVGDAVSQTDARSYVDLAIQFIGASGLPKLDVVGSADPYFVAKLDHKISFVSTVKENTQQPVWNEIWRVKNVPTTADLSVEVLDKDEAAAYDDYVGKFNISISPGAKEAEIEGPVLRKKGGTFWIRIDSSPAQDPKPHLHSYVFDGPVRYSRHNSPTVGLFTNRDDTRLYSTWKLYLKSVPIFFSADVPPQHWNRDYKAAQSIFQGPASIAVRGPIQAGHRMLYARTSHNGFGLIDGPRDVMNLLHGGAGSHASGSDSDKTAINPAGAPITTPSPDPAASVATPFAHRVKPAVYTYILSNDDDSFRFSETGAAFFVDFASKHALHSNCSEFVRFSGEFHPRPVGGWQNFNDNIRDEDIGWELVIDNNSGTYSPDPMLLPNLKELLEYNFPGFGVVALDFKNPALAESRDACRAYALKYRGVQQEELQPTAKAGEVTLSNEARDPAAAMANAGRAIRDTLSGLAPRKAAATS